MADREQAAGGVLTAKQAPHRPGTAPALGLRAGAMSLHSNADYRRVSMLHPNDEHLTGEQQAGDGALGRRRGNSRPAVFIGLQER